MNESQDIKSCDSADLARMHPSILAFVGGVHRVGFYFDLGAVILKTRIRARPFLFRGKRPPSSSAQKIPSPTSYYWCSSLILRPLSVSA